MALSRVSGSTKTGKPFGWTRIGCARCHNHPLEKYTQDDFHQFSAFFSRMHLDRKEPVKGATVLVTRSKERVELARKLEEAGRRLEEAQKKALSADQVQLKASLLQVLDAVRDESGKQDAVRLVFEPKTRTVEQAELITQLLAHTSLETSCPLNLTMVGLDGKPRALHLDQAMASIDFNDFAPALAPRVGQLEGGVMVRNLVRDPLFDIDHVSATGIAPDRRAPGRAGLMAVVSGRVQVRGGGQTVGLGPGDFAVLPAGMKDLVIDAGSGAGWLHATRR